nr:MAG TPA: hypothetical protein [Caudoviricetes sp.]
MPIFRLKRPRSGTTASHRGISVCLATACGILDGSIITLTWFAVLTILQIAQTV